MTRKLLVKKMQKRANIVDWLTAACYIIAGATVIYGLVITMLPELLYIHVLIVIFGSALTLISVMLRDTIASKYEAENQHDFQRYCINRDCKRKLAELRDESITTDENDE